MLIGANDACTSSVSTMTSVDSFRTSIRSGLQTLANGGVTTVFVSSVPDIYQLWQVGKSSSSARTAWAVYGICQSMLRNPTSTQQADVTGARRCGSASWTTTRCWRRSARAVTGCVFDGNAVFGYPFSLSQLSTWDYFHPNTSGQAALASVDLVEGVGGHRLVARAGTSNRYEGGRRPSPDAGPSPPNGQDTDAQIAHGNWVIDEIPSFLAEMYQPTPFLSGALTLMRAEPSFP